MDQVDPLWVFQEIPVLEDLGFVYGVVDQGAVVVTKWWDGVGLASFADSCEGPYVLCINSLMELVMCPFVFGLSDTEFQGFGCCFVLGARQC